MHKKVYDLLEEVSRPRPSSRHKLLQCFSTIDQKETVKISPSPKDKRLKSYVLTKLNKIQIEKKDLLSKKRKALLLYKMVVDKMVSPLIEYMPNIATNYHLTKLTDFRTYDDGFSEISKEISKKKNIAHSKCLEEPLPILIKPEYKVLKCPKKEWKIVKKFQKAIDTKNQLIDKYKIFKSKIIREPETNKKLDRRQRLKDLNFALMYDLFLKEAVESRVENLMPSIKARNKHSNVYDFRFQRESEVEQCERRIIDNEEVAAAPNNYVKANSYLNKGLHRNKTSIINPLHTKIYNKTHPVTVKNKLHETASVKKKEEKAQGLNVKQAIYLKEENLGKSHTQRALHKQNWAKSDNRIKIVKPETVKNKPESIKIGPNKKNLAETQPLISNEFASGNQHINNGVSSRKHNKENEDKKVVLNTNLITTENVSEIVSGNTTESGPHDMIQLSDNLLNESRSSCIMVTEISAKGLEGKTEGNSVCGNLLSPYNTDSKPETAVVKTLEESVSQCDHKLNSIHDEPNKTINGSKMIFGNDRLTQESDDTTESQNKDRNKIIKSTTENINKQGTILSESLLLDDQKVADCLVSKSKPEEDNRLISDNNLLKNTYLVSFKVNDDEACLKTRSQIINDEIKGDLIDLNIVLEEEKKARNEEEKKARNEEKSKIFSENKKHTNSSLNVLSSSVKSDSDSQIRLYLPKSADINKEYRNFSSAISQDFLTYSPKRDLTKGEIKIKSSKPTSDFHTNNISQNLNKNKVADDKLIERASNINSEKKGKTKTQEKNKENVKVYYNINTKAEGDILNDTKVEQKKAQDKVNSLELIGKGKTGKVLKHQKVFREKGNPIFNTISEKRKENLTKSKGHDNDNKYQGIINSVQKIIDTGNSNESLLGRNKSKTAFSGTKIKYNSDITDKYSKTIDKLKEIINELPGGNNEKVTSTEKSKHSSEKESKGHKTNKNPLKTVQTERILNKQKNLGNKLTSNTNNRIKQINLKTVNVVNKIDNINKDLKESNTDKIDSEMNLEAGSRKEDSKTDLKVTNPNTFMKENLKSNNRSHIDQPENTKGNFRIMTSNIERINPLKHQRLSTPSDEITISTPGKEEEGRSRKSKSVLDIKYNERKMGRNRELRRNNSSMKNIRSDEINTNTSITGLTKLSLKSRNKFIDYENNSPQDQSLPKTKHKESVNSSNSDTNNTSCTKNRYSSHLNKSTDSKLLLFEEKESNKYSISLKGKGDLNMADKNKDPKRIRVSSKRVKSVELETGLSVTGARRSPPIITDEIAKETRGKKSKDQRDATSKGNEALVSDKKDDKKPNFNEKEKQKIAMERTVKSSTNSAGTQRKITKFTHKNELDLKKKIKHKSEDNLIRTEKEVSTMKEKRNDVKTVTMQSDGTLKLTQDSRFQEKNSKPKVKKQPQPTGISPRKTLKNKTISNENLKTDFHTSKSSGIVNTPTKSNEQSIRQLKKVDENNKELLKKAVNRRLHQKAKPK